MAFGPALACFVRSSNILDRQFTVTPVLLGDEYEMCKRTHSFNETEGGDPMSSEIKLRAKLWFVEGSLEQPPRSG